MTTVLSESSQSASRCQHRSRTGRRCRQPLADSKLGLCAKHAQPHHSLADFSRALTRDAQHFQTAVGIHTSLSRLYKLLAQDRIPSRRAAVLAYISSLQLRALPLALSEVRAEQDKGPVRVDVEFPRPQPLALGAEKD